MKKLFFSTLLFLFAYNAIAQTDSLTPSIKIGYIDIDSILEISPEKSKIEKQIQTATAEYEKEFKRMQQEYNKKVKDYLKNNNEMLDAIKKARQAEITEAEKRLATYKIQYKEQIKHEQDSLMKALEKNISFIINQIAQEQNITIVLDKKHTHYLAPNCIDLFPFVEKKLLKK